MAKLTVSFKGNLITTHQLDSGIVTIGRDPDNTICIDSLAIAPKHLIIDLEHADGPQLVCEDERFPVEVNGRRADRHPLSHGDIIHIGKHTLHYTASEQIIAAIDAPADPPAAESPEASLQILNGKNIGRVIPLKRALTRLGKGGSVAIIARRKNGYFLSGLEGGEQIKVNSNPLGNQTIQLNPGDQLEIDNNRLVFHD